METTVNDVMAELFYQQCTGTTPGHMANIPNNPALYVMCRVSRAENRKDFSRFLRQVADRLEREETF